MRAFFLVIAVFLAGCAGSAKAPSGLHPIKLTLSPESVEQMLLTGPPQTAGMVSGRVVLKPGEVMHRHSTEGNEELLVILAGKGHAVLGQEPLPFAAGDVLYVPPHTEHEVHNDGAEELRYIFIVAPLGR